MAEALINSLTATSLFDLTGVVAVITGGGTGIGLMLASTLIANGANVYITGRRQDVLERITRIYNQAAAKTPGRGRLVALRGDVTQKSEAIRLADEIGKREPSGVTVLFNNAGILIGGVHPPTEATAKAFFESYFNGVTQDEFTQTYATNAMSNPAGGSNELGQTSHDNVEFPFEVPANKKGGSARDIGAVALALIANWFINGETVLVDGGTLLVHPSSW
ncbi:NAD(P)-binding protein [Auriscalpium vulgare]|uniref:NAD(P)-binding protein n=1 Tax=Auriscalpium vulgare TaxID=40419 RepID=A0ACB8RMC0_9AGAM|nr:NAD(P)-binding protein [Auriscalpium vulgare]